MVIAKDVIWDFTFDEGDITGNEEIVFRKNQLKETPEIVKIIYQYSKYEFRIKK